MCFLGSRLVTEDYGSGSEIKIFTDPQPLLPRFDERLNDTCFLGSGPVTKDYGSGSEIKNIYGSTTPAA